MYLSIQKVSTFKQSFLSNSSQTFELDLCLWWLAENLERWLTMDTAMPCTRPFIESNHFHPPYNARTCNSCDIAKILFVLKTNRDTDRVLKLQRNLAFHK